MHEFCELKTTVIILNLLYHFPKKRNSECETETRFVLCPFWLPSCNLANRLNNTECVKHTPRLSFFKGARYFSNELLHPTAKKNELTTKFFSRKSGHTGKIETAHIYRYLKTAHILNSIFKHMVQRLVTNFYVI